MARSRKASSSTPSHTLQWTPKKRAKRTYELRDGDKVIGGIRWPKLFGSLAEAEFGKSRWTFKRAGFLHPRVVVREPPSESDFAVLELSWGRRGMLRVGDSSVFRWFHKGFWTSRFVFARENGAELIVFKPALGLTRRSCAVTVSQEASELRQLGLLVTLGWYVIHLMADDDYSSAASVAVACS